MEAIQEVPLTTVLHQSLSRLVSPDVSSTRDVTGLPITVLKTTVVSTKPPSLSPPGHVIVVLLFPRVAYPLSVSMKNLLTFCLFKNP